MVKWKLTDRPVSPPGLEASSGGNDDISLSSFKYLDLAGTEELEKQELNSEYEQDMSLSSASSTTSSSRASSTTQEYRKRSGTWPS